MTELMEGVGDVGLEEAEDEADNGRIYNVSILEWRSKEKPYHYDNYACTRES